MRLRKAYPENPPTLVVGSVKAKKVVRWFEPGRSTGWDKDDSAIKRRRTVLTSRGGDLLASARAMQSLSNVTRDLATKRLARSDALYFYTKYRKKRGGNEKASQKGF